MPEQLTDQEGCKQTLAIEFLLVEDSPVDIELAMHAFESHNLAHRICVLRDGVEALDYLFCTGDYKNRQPGNPKAILLDLKLPRLDGLEVLHRIRADERTRTIPVIILTSSRQQGDVLKSYQLGVNSYIVKPVDFDLFSEAVRNLGLYWLEMNQPPTLEM